MDASFNPDVIVKWRDGSQNCVAIKDLKSMRKGREVNCVGAPVKMLYNKKWYYGKVIATEQNDQNLSEKNTREESSSDDEPLINIKTRNEQPGFILDEKDPYSDIDIEDPQDPDFIVQSTNNRKRSVSSETVCIDNKKQRNVDVNKSNDVQSLLTNADCYREQHCEAVGCHDEVFSACERCFILLCWQHFDNNLDCTSHTTVSQLNTLNHEPTDVVEDIAVFDDSLTLMEGVETPPLQIQNQHCEVIGCKKMVSSSCFTCTILVCWDHFSDPTCVNHQKNNSSHVTEPLLDFNVLEDTSCLPENFEIEGAPREIVRSKKVKENVKKNNQEKKNSGQEYVTQTRKVIISKKVMGPTCDMIACKRECYRFMNDVREDIFNSYWQQRNIHLQREFIIRHVQKRPAKRHTAGPDSRRQSTFDYHFTIAGKLVQVCRKFFLNTLGISERTVKTALAKVTKTGMLEKDKRGGRRQCFFENDALMREMINKHIDRFPRVESHYCREKSTREYLHPDLTLAKMYHMYKEENKNSSVKPSLSSYRRIFKSKNLSFFRPKKDQCSLCMTYLQGSEETKNTIQEKYNKHQEEKSMFRSIRVTCKKLAQENPLTTLCATFDLQQVISLPRSNESAVFYKRRLSTYNFTIYDMATGDCTCYTWHEGDSKRGSSEISTALYDYLMKSDAKGIRTVYLFADGCGGQNKNSIVASTLIYIINNAINIQDIILRFSVPNHGQSEGDSVHSTIGFALKKSGDIIVPSQLHPVFRLARRNKPYDVKVLTYADFLDFKQFSKNLRLLKIRKDDENQEGLDWTEMREVSVKKYAPQKLFFKTSFSQDISRAISLPRQVASLLSEEIGCLNSTPPKIPKAKYSDLVSLTTGENPVIRCPEHVSFYRSLPN